MLFVWVIPKHQLRCLYSPQQRRNEDNRKIHISHHLTQMITLTFAEIVQGWIHQAGCVDTPIISIVCSFVVVMQGECMPDHNLHLLNFQFFTQLLQDIFSLDIGYQICILSSYSSSSQSHLLDLCDSLRPNSSKFKSI